MKVKTTLLVLLLLFVSQISFSQQNQFPQNSLNPCGSLVPDDQWESQFSKLIQEFKENMSNAKVQSQLYTIPVIVHVVHSGQAVGTFPNLAQGQIASQIRVLNEDFGGVGYNKGNYPASAFSAYALSQSLSSNNLDVLGRVKIANCEVEFCLATKDTLGNTLPEPGIDRINYITKGWTNPASFGNTSTFINYVNATIKPQSIWNTTKYFNIWITDINSATGLLGFATFPPFSNLNGLNIGSNGTAQTDGVWCWARSFGSAGTFPSGSYANGYNRGRTCTHEVGHWLGLRHIWGDGTCLTDYCDDTPPASASNFGNPIYPYKTTNCSGNSPNGEMFMNFMDYTNDPIKFMYTTEQAIRVQTAMQNSPYRKQLGTHNLCSVTQVPAFAQFNVPANACENNPVSMINISYGTPVPNYTWTASGPATFNPGPNSDPVTISFPSAGIYTVTLTADNGTMSVYSKTIQIAPSPTLSVIGAGTVVCMNDDIVIIAAGANTYTWQPGNFTGNTFAYTATGQQTIQLSGTGDGNCQSTLTLNIEVSECVGLKPSENFQMRAEVFPNPLQDVLYIRHYGLLESYRMTDLSGRTMLQGKAACNSSDCVQTLSTESIHPGIYFIELKYENGNTGTLKLIKY